MSPSTSHAEKSRKGGMDISDAKRLKALEAKNTELERRHSGAMLDDT